MEMKGPVSWFFQNAEDRDLDPGAVSGGNGQIQTCLPVASTGFVEGIDVGCDFLSEIQDSGMIPKFGPM